jgi:hypothetical protein
MAEPCDENVGKAATIDVGMRELETASLISPIIEGSGLSANPGGGSIKLLFRFSELSC